MTVRSISSSSSLSSSSSSATAFSSVLAWMAGELCKFACVKFSVFFPDFSHVFYSAHILVQVMQLLKTVLWAYI